MPIILLTTTVNVQNKIALLQTDPYDRINTYTKSVYQWLSKTNLPIVIVENTGYSFPEWNNWKEEYKDRFEVISFCENELDEAQYLKNNDSKGASEIFAINYAYLHSKIISKYSFIIKVTGRFFIPKLEIFLESIDINSYFGLTQNNISCCQIVGTNISYFDNIFHPNLINKNGNYDGHVENIYKERMLDLPENKVLRCPIFEIEPTLEGGGSKIFTSL
jgi:hypothetical protein